MLSLRDINLTQPTVNAPDAATPSNASAQVSARPGDPLPPAADAHPSTMAYVPMAIMRSGAPLAPGHEEASAVPLVQAMSSGAPLAPAQGELGAIQAMRSEAPLAPVREEASTIYLVRLEGANGPMDVTTEEVCEHLLTVLKTNYLGYEGLWPDIEGFLAGLRGQGANGETLARMAQDNCLLVLKRELSDTKIDRGSRAQLVDFLAAYLFLVFDSKKGLTPRDPVETWREAFGIGPILLSFCVQMGWDTESVLANVIDNSRV